MNHEELHVLAIPGRAPSDSVWERIEKHLDEKKHRQTVIPAWCYALAILSINLIASAIISGYFR